MRFTLPLPLQQFRHAAGQGRDYAIEYWRRFDEMVAWGMPRVSKAIICHVIFVNEVAPCRVRGRGVDVSWEVSQKWIRVDIIWWGKFPFLDAEYWNSWRKRVEVANVIFVSLVYPCHKKWNVPDINPTFYRIKTWNFIITICWFYKLNFTLWMA